MSGSRSYGWLLCEEGVWVVITAIMWIARPCVAHVAKLNYEVFECVHVHPTVSMSLSLTSCIRVTFEKEEFHVLK